MRRSRPDKLASVPSETLLAWLEQGAEFAIYALSGGKLEYANSAFRGLLDEHGLDLAELTDRARLLPAGGPPDASPGTVVERKLPLRLPAQFVRLSGRDGAIHRVIANEWLMSAGDSPSIVGCLDPLAIAPDSGRALLRMSLYDALTGLPGRSLLEDRLFQSIARVRRNGKLAALLYADLDGFKPINDRHGHQAGDLVLQTVGKRILASVRETDTVARLGGDEFAIVLDAPEQLAQVEMIARKLIASVAEPIELPDGATVCVTCSVGISLCPTNGMNLRALVNAADRAMYLSKSLGHGQFCVSAEPAAPGEPEHWIDDQEVELFGVPPVDQQHARLIAMVNRLHQAIDNGDSYAVQAPLLDELIGYAQFHFASEEALMDRYGDPDAAAHKREHEQLIAQVLYFRRTLASGDGQIILSALRPWLIRHIQSHDRTLGLFLRARGVR